MVVVVFDLDDTLYPDLSYVYSGFQTVATYLSSLLCLTEKQIFEALKAELSVKRNGVFDRFLIKQGVYTKQLVKRCLSVYRHHDPQIKLYPDALTCLQRLKEFPLYVVTDGNKLVQKKKFLALGLDRYIKKCLCTYAYGLQHSKPSPYCFQKICLLEGVAANQVVYIGDNPLKDFVGIKPLGFQTIRVLTGPYQDQVVDPSYDAAIIVNNLSELNKSSFLYK